MILSIVAGVMVLLTVTQRIHENQVPERDYVSGSYLIQGLDSPQVSSILIGSGVDAVKLKRKGNGFVVASKDDYPAVMSKINKLVRTCLDIRTINKVTSDASNHFDLEVVEDKARTLVKFFRADPNEEDQLITGVVVGKTETQTNQVYVRKADSDEVYTVKTAPVVRKSSLDYVEKEIVNIIKDRVKSVTVSSSEGSYVLRVEDGNDSKIILEGLPEGREIHDSNCESVLSALSSFSFSDLSSASSMPDLKFDRSYVSELNDTVVYSFDIAQSDDKSYVKCTANYSGDKLIIEDPDKLAEIAAKIAASGNARKFSQRHSGWVYEISEWKAKNLIRKFEELLKAEEEPTVSEDLESEVGPKAEGEDAK
jgi:hypothetical protein